MPLTQDQKEVVEWALVGIRERQSDYATYHDYYKGDHTRMMDDARLAKIFGNLFDDFALNLCQPVVDALADRLSISSFSAGGGTEDEKALEIWKRNRMRRRAGQVHMEAISSGDAYVIVWPDRNQNATIYPHPPGLIAVEYDDNQPGLITQAAKLFSEVISRAGTTRYRDRLTVYYPDRIERYATSERASQYDSNTGSFSPYTDDSDGWRVDNPYAQVPVFHFANNADLGSFGVSELYNAVPVQNALNFQAFHLLVGTEFQGFRQRWATGIEIQKDPETNQPINPFVAGPERIFVTGPTDSDNAKFGEFSAADLNQLDNVKKSWALDMAQVTQTPPHYFFATSQLVSGESQKTAEQKLDAKVADRQESFGDTWAAAIALAVRQERGLASDGLELDANWKDLKPRNELEQVQIAKEKKDLGVGRVQILKELGYTQEQIEGFAEEDAAVGLGQGSNDPLRDIATQVLANGNGGTLPLR